MRLQTSTVAFQLT